MSDERLRVLEMFKEGKLTMEETLELLGALEEMKGGPVAENPELEIIEGDESADVEALYEAIANDTEYISKDNIEGDNKDNVENNGASGGWHSNHRSSRKFSFKMPKINVFKGNGADFISDINIPEIKIPEIKIPNINIPEIKIPPINIPNANAGSNHHSGHNININSIGKYDGNIEADNISISGMGSFGGNVQADKVSISGVGDFKAELQADRLSVTGKANVGGIATVDQVTVSGLISIGSDLHADKLSVSGRASINSELKCDSFTCSGDISIGRDIYADKIAISGNLHAGGSINTDTFALSGRAKVGGDVNTDKFESKGSFDIAGSLRADSVMIELNNDCSVREEIIADAIVVQKGKYRDNAHLSVKSIQADRVELVNAKVQLVKGDTVIVGTGCVIDKVEYMDSLTVLNGATVNQQIKID